MESEEIWLKLLVMIKECISFCKVYIDRVPAKAVGQPTNLALHHVLDDCKCEAHIPNVKLVFHQKWLSSHWIILFPFFLWHNEFQL